MCPWDKGLVLMQPIIITSVFKKYVCEHGCPTAKILLDLLPKLVMNFTRTYELKARRRVQKISTHL